MVITYYSKFQEPYVGIIHNGIKQYYIMYLNPDPVYKFYILGDYSRW